ncbi:MAG TPA: S-layer protein, partial [Methanoregulaceae archaeon]|nr:S-layer protein [Methanoregulaceae archaeon]
MYHGSSETITVEYENAGETPVYSAQARIIAQDPFTCTKNIAFLGDLGPGERAVARFEISADKFATQKEYGLDTEIRYRDALDNSWISDPMVVEVRLVGRTVIGEILASPVILSIIGALVVLVLYYAVFHRRKKNNA